MFVALVCLEVGIATRGYLISVRVGGELSTRMMKTRVLETRISPRMSFRSSGCFSSASVTMNSMFGRFTVPCCRFLMLAMTVGSPFPQNRLRHRAPHPIPSAPSAECPLAAWFSGLV